MYRPHKTVLDFLAILLSAARTTFPAGAQQYNYQTPLAPGIATPDRVGTSIGTLNLTDSYPQPDTVEKIYDNLDRSRAL